MTQVHPVVSGPAASHNGNLSTHEENNQTQATFTISRQSSVIKVDNDVAKPKHTEYEYLKLDSDTNTLEWDEIKRWGLKEPNILICVTGGRNTSVSPGDLIAESLRYLLKFALRADPWIIIGDTNTDFKKRLWKTALKYGMFPKGRIPILDIVSLDRAATKLSENEGETKYRVNTACLDLYQTHIVLIDNTSQQTHASLEEEFCRRIMRGMRDKSCLMIFLIMGGDGKPAVRISTPNIFLGGSGGDDDSSVPKNGPRTETQGNYINTSNNHKEFPECGTLPNLGMFIGSASDVDKKLFEALSKDERIDKERIKLAIICNNMDFAKKETKTDYFIQLQKQDQLEILEFAIVYNRVQLVQVLIDIGVNVNEILKLQTHLYTEGDLKNMTIVKKLVEKAEKENSINEDGVTELASFVKEWEELFEDGVTELASFGKEWEELPKNSSSDRKNKSKLPRLAAHFFFFWSLTDDRMELAQIFSKLHQEPIAAALKAAHVLKKLGEQNKTYYEKFKSEAKYFEQIGIDLVNSCYKQNEQKAMDLLNRKLKYWSESKCINIALTSRNKLFLSQPVCMRLMKTYWFGKICVDCSYKLIGMSTIIFPAIFRAVEFNGENKSKSNATPNKKRKISMQGEFNGEKFDSHKSKSNATPNKKRKISKWSKLNLFYTAPVVIFFLNCLSHLAFLGLYSYVLVVVFSPNYHMIEGIVFFWVLTITMEEIRQIYSGKKLSKLKLYFGNKWNWLDIAIIIDFSIGLALRFIPKSECFETSRVLFSLNLIFFFFRFLHTLSATRTLGPMLTMIWKMFGILLKFLFILMTFIAAYAIASEAILYPETQLSWKLLYYLPRRAYWHLYGELFLDDMEGQSSCTNDPAMYSNYVETRCPSELGKVVGPILMGIYVLLSNILLMNLLIALLSHEIQKVYDNANNHWSLQRLNLILEYQSRPFLPPPFIIIIHVCRLIKLIKERISKTANESSEYDEELARCEYDEELARCEYDEELARCEYHEELARWERCMARSFVDSQDKTNTDSSEENLTKEEKCKQSKIANQDAEVPLKDNENKDNKARNNTTSEIQAISSGISELREEIKLLKENMNNTNQSQQNQFSEFSRVINMLKASVDELTTLTARQIPPPAVYSPPDKSFLETHEFPPTSWIAEQTTSPLQLQYQDAPLTQEEINQMHRSEEMGRESGPGSSASHYHVLPPIQPDRTESNV